MTLPIAIFPEQISQFCQRWDVTELALFGSILRADFGPASDVDVIVTFAPDAHRTLFDLVEMQNALAEIFGRSVDLLTRRAIEASCNPYRRRAILESAQPIYVEG